MTKLFSIDTELGKLKCVFRAIKDDWANKPELIVVSKDFKDVVPAGEIIDSFMRDLLFGNNFGYFTLFVGIIASPTISFWLVISEDDQTSCLKATFQVFFEREELGPHFDGEIELASIRTTLWNVYSFFNDGNHFMVNAEEKFESLFSD